MRQVMSDGAMKRQNLNAVLRKGGSQMINGRMKICLTLLIISLVEALRCQIQVLSTVL